MKNQKHRNTEASSHPLSVRIICWILIILMVGGALYSAVVGLQALFASIAENAAKTASLTDLPQIPALLQTVLPSLRI